MTKQLNIFNMYKNKIISEKHENFDIKKLLVTVGGFLIFLLTIFWEPIRKAWSWRNEFWEKYPWLGKHAFVSTIIVSLFLIWTFLNWLIKNYEDIKKLLTPKEIVLEERNKKEIKTLFTEYVALINQKNCWAVASFETTYVYADKDRKETWISDCERNISNILAHDQIIYRFDKNDWWNTVEALAFEINDERIDWSIIKRMYERRYYFRKEPNTEFWWLITWSTRNLIKIEKRTFEEPK